MGWKMKVPPGEIPPPKGYRWKVELEKLIEKGIEPDPELESYEVWGKQPESKKEQKRKVVDMPPPDMEGMAHIRKGLEREKTLQAKSLGKAPGTRSIITSSGPPWWAILLLIVMTMALVVVTLKGVGCP